MRHRKHVSIPSSSGRTFGLTIFCTEDCEAIVSIPSSSGRTFGRDLRQRQGHPVYVSIPSSGARSDNFANADVRALTLSQSLLRQGARSDDIYVVETDIEKQSQSLLRQGARSDAMALRNDAACARRLNPFFVRAVRTRWPYETMQRALGVSTPSSSGRTFGPHWDGHIYRCNESQSLLRQGARSDHARSLDLDRLVLSQSLLRQGARSDARTHGRTRGGKQVSIPSSSGRTFGRPEAEVDERCTEVSIPSSSGRTFGRRTRRTKSSMWAASQSLLRQGARSDVEGGVGVA